MNMDFILQGYRMQFILFKNAVVEVMDKMKKVAKTNRYSDAIIQQPGACSLSKVAIKSFQMDSVISLGTSSKAST